MERQVEADADGPAPPEEFSANATGAPPAPITMTLPAQAQYVRLARLVAAGLANELGFDVERLDDVRLAVGEACGLTVHLGATTISLAYVLDEHHLGVTIDATLDGDAGDRLDSEHLALVEQVLAVAGSDHRIDRQDQRMSIGVSFTDGT